MKNKTKKRKIVKLIGAVLEWLVYMFAYTIVFLFTNYVFDSFIVDEAHLVLYSFLASNKIIDIPTNNPKAIIIEYQYI